MQGAEEVVRGLLLRLEKSPPFFCLRVCWVAKKTPISINKKRGDIPPPQQQTSVYWFYTMCHCSYCSALPIDAARATAGNMQGAVVGERTGDRWVRSLPSSFLATSSWVAAPRAQATWAHLSLNWWMVVSLSTCRITRHTGSISCLWNLHLQRRSHWCLLPTPGVGLTAFKKLWALDPGGLYLLSSFTVVYGEHKLDIKYCHSIRHMHFTFSLHDHEWLHRMQSWVDLEPSYLVFQYAEDI